jgi:hypothetical protein
MNSFTHAASVRHPKPCERRKPKRLHPLDHRDRRQSQQSRHLSSWPRVCFTTAACEPKTRSIMTNARPASVSSRGSWRRCRRSLRTPSGKRSKLRLPSRSCSRRRDATTECAWPHRHRSVTGDSSTTAWSAQERVRRPVRVRTILCVTDDSNVPRHAARASFSHGRSA